MKNVMLAIISITLSLVIYQCKTKKDEFRISQITSFPKSHKIKGKVIQTADSLFFPRKCYSIANKLIVFDGKSDKFLHFYNLNNFSLIRKYGIIGRGPGEFQNPSANDFYISERQDQQFIWLSDNDQIIKMNLDSVLYNQNYIYKNKVSITKELSPNNYIYAISDSIIIGCLSAPFKKQFFFLNPTRKHYIKKSYYPKISFDIPRKEFINQVYFSTVTPQLDKQLMICGYSYFPIIDIISFNNEHKLRIELKDYNEPNFRFQENRLSTKNCILYNSEIMTTSTHIFSLNWNKSISQLNSSEDPGAPTILVYDFEGNPIYKLMLDKPINTFCIDEERNRIIGINPLNKPNKSIVIYELPTKINL